MSEWTLVDVLYALARRRRFVLGATAISFVVSIVVSLLLPKWYRASATVMPPRRDLGLFSLEQTIPVSSFNLLGYSEETLKYKAILESRVVAEKVIRKFRIMERYGKRRMDDAIRYLRKKTSVDINEENTITISVLDRDPETAASMANEFVRLLDSLLTHFEVEKAKNDRIFIANRLEQNKRDLQAAEDRLKEFSLKYGTFDISLQTQAEIQHAAEVQARIYATEVELGVKSRYLSPEHDEIRRLRFQLEELRRQLGEMRYGPNSSLFDEKSAAGLVIPFEQLPSVAIQYGQLYREVRVQRQLYEFLTEQYEQARIREARTTPVIQVLDPAVPPQRKAKPKRALIVLASTGVVGIWACLVVLLLARAEEIQHRDPERYRKYVELVWLFKPKPSR
ncbi:MAG: Wzz/FepE/Etk N-terminal domain-containing protein [candidate division KSB1 bacterium]|nr:Wzz/FepE/Etk N-terminal domain-containing protein [candidate division KSB1 bacterium]